MKSNKSFLELKKYFGYEFSSGCYTGEDYKIFERKYLKHIKNICEDFSWEFVKGNKGHYFCSAFVKNKQNSFVYISIEDVRYRQDEWFGNVLVRTAKDEKDYRGGQNNYCGLSNLAVAIDCLFQRV